MDCNLEEIKWYDKTILNYNLYKVIFMITLVLHTITFLESAVTKTLKIFLIWGIILLAYDLFKRKNLNKLICVKLTIFFLLIHLLSTIINHNANFSSNLKIFVYVVIQMLAITLIDYKREKENILKDLILFNNVFKYMTLILGIIALMFFFGNFYFHISNNVEMRPIGYYQGRLSGLYGSPSILAQISIASIIATIINIIYNREHGKTSNKINILNLIVQYLSFILSNSRAVIVGSLVAIGLFIIIYIFITRKNQSIVKKIGVSSLAILISIGTLYVGTKAIKQAISVVPKYVKVGDILKNSKVTVTQDSVVKLDRDELEDVSNGRFDIWNAGLKIVKNNPILGVGYSNINTEANKFLSEFYNKRFPNLSSNMHNLLLQICAGFGIFACLVFVIIIIKVSVNYFKAIFLPECKDIKYIIPIFSLLVVFFVINLFDTNILYTQTILLSIIFWYYYGVGSYLLNDQKKISRY